MFIRRSGYDDYLDDLAGLPMFSGLRRKELARIGTLTTYARLGGGRELCIQGTRPAEAFIILSGSVAVSSGGVLISRLERGDTISVWEVLTRSPRTMTAVAEGTVEVLVLTVAELRRLTYNHPMVASRLRKAGDEIRTRDFNLGKVGLIG